MSAQQLGVRENGKRQIRQIRKGKVKKDKLLIASFLPERNHKLYKEERKQKSYIYKSTAAPVH